MLLCVCKAYLLHVEQVIKSGGEMLEKTRVTVRVGVIMGTDVRDWFKSRAYDMGVSMSSLMAVALHQYREQQEVLSKMRTDEWGNMVKLALMESEAKK